MMMISVEERVRYLMKVALRAEGEGEHRIARSFRRMAEEARLDLPGSSMEMAWGCGSE